MSLRHQQNLGRTSTCHAPKRPTTIIYLTTIATLIINLITSDVLGLAWPESPGLGLAYKGPGLFKPQARPRWWA